MSRKEFRDLRPTGCVMHETAVNAAQLARRSNNLFRYRKVERDVPTR